MATLGLTVDEFWTPGRYTHEQRMAVRDWLVRHLPAPDCEYVLSYRLVAEGVVDVVVQPPPIRRDSEWCWRGPVVVQVLCQEPPPLIETLA